MIKKFTTSVLATTLIVGSFMPTMSSANEIFLTLKDQDVTISGEFAGFQQEAYLITTSEGVLHVPAKYVTCEGDACLIIVASGE